MLWEHERNQDVGKDVARTECSRNWTWTISGYGHGCTENGMPSAWAESGCAHGSGLNGTNRAWM